MEHDLLVADESMSALRWIKERPERIQGSQTEESELVSTGG